MAFSTRKIDGETREFRAKHSCKKILSSISHSKRIQTCSFFFLEQKKNVRLKLYVILNISQFRLIQFRSKIYLTPSFLRTMLLNYPMQLPAVIDAQQSRIVKIVDARRRKYRDNSESKAIVHANRHLCNSTIVHRFSPRRVEPGRTRCLPVTDTRFIKTHY